MSDINPPLGSLSSLEEILYRDAIQAILNERAYQIDLGYTTSHDMQHTPAKILGYGITPTTFSNPSEDDLIRLGACALAALVRILISPTN